MKKIKILTKKVEGFNLTFTLTQTDGFINHSHGKPMYGIIGETDDDICVIPNLSCDRNFSEILFEKLFRNDVTPTNLEDIITDLNINI